MKIKFVALVVFLLGFSVFAQAQKGGRRSQSQGFNVSERVDETMKKLSAITLSSEQKASLEKIFTTYFEVLQKEKASGSRDRELVEELAKKRDTSVKNILSSSQYVDYKIIMDKTEESRGRKSRRNTA